MSQSPQSSTPNLPLGRLVPQTKRSRPLAPAAKPPASTQNEAGFLLILGVGGALWLAVLAGIGFLLMNPGDPASGSPPEILSVVELMPMPGQEPEDAPLPIAIAEEAAEIAASPEFIAAPAETVAQSEIAPLPAAVAEEKSAPVEVAAAAVVPETVEPAALKPAVKEEPVPTSCDKLGTRIIFHKNPTDAFKQAKQEKKMVFMIHLSGNFEDKEFT